MGAAFSGPADKMAETQRRMAERQLEMQQVMRERMMAAQIASARDLLNFYLIFYGIAGTGLLVGAAKKGHPAFLAPLVPLTIALAYQYDMAYYTKMDRIVAEAEHILAHERHLLAMPGGPVTVQAVDAVIEARAAARAMATAKGGATTTTATAKQELK